MSPIDFLCKAACRLHCQALVRPLVKAFYNSRKWVLPTPPLSYLENICKRIEHSCISKQEKPLSDELVDLMIVVPCYNVERYVEECIGSVFAQQTQFSYVVVAVNDGSTDRTLQHLQRYEKHPNFVLISQENRGFSGARNRGLELLRGRYVTFLDSDDRLPQGAVEALMSKARETGADIVQGGYSTFSQDGAPLKRFIPHTRELWGFPWGKVYRAEMFSRIEFPEQYWFEDTVCCMILHEMTQKKATVPAMVYDYRQNTKGIMHTCQGNPKIVDALWVTLQLLADHDSLGLPITEDFYRIVLADARNTAAHIHTLHDSKADYAHFLISQSLQRKYGAGMPALQGSQGRIERSLINGDFGGFMAEVILRR